MGKRKSNQLEGPFIAHALEMRLSPAWRAASSEVRLLLDRLEVEHAANGGAQNGQLVVTYDQFAEWGLRRASVAAALREAVALGFVEVTRRGRRAYGGAKVPSTYRLTYIAGRRASPSPTNEWRRLKTLDEARAALSASSLPPKRSRLEPEIRNAGRAGAPETGRAGASENAFFPDAPVSLLARTHG